MQRTEMGGGATPTRSPIGGSAGHSREYVPIAVIGGGPAGLSIGRELGRRGLDYLILERGGGAGESWSRMWRNMTLNTPWKMSSLPGTRIGWRGRNRLWPRSRFHAYLLRYAQDNHLRIRLRTEVTRIDKVDGTPFRIHTRGGLLQSAVVINSTGYFSNPYTPRYPGLEATRIPSIHVAEYGDPQRARCLAAENGKRVLIVGKRISAGQVALELHDAAFDVTVSHRSQIDFSPDPRLVQISFPIYYQLERALLRFEPFARKDSFGRMQGGRTRRLIESGAIRTVPDVASFRERSVVFRDGAEKEFDLVLWATGFRPALDHLKHLIALDLRTGLPVLEHNRSRSVQGLYFIGLDQQQDFTSRMLRGIRREVVELAEGLQAAGLSRTPETASAG